jgi:hypothetical protein
MKFVSPRKMVLAHLGHVLTFEKNVPQFVPPALHKKALDEGLEAEPEGDEVAPEKSPAVVNDTVRLETLKDAMRAIATRNDPDDFTAGGAPKVRAIEALTDGMKPANAAELHALWAEVVAAVTP